MSLLFKKKKPCTHCLLVFISSYWSQLIHSLVLWLCRTFHKKGHLKYRLLFHGGLFLITCCINECCSFVHLLILCFSFFLKQGLRFPRLCLNSVEEDLQLLVILPHLQYWGSNQELYTCTKYRQIPRFSKSYAIFPLCIHLFFFFCINVHNLLFY